MFAGIRELFKKRESSCDQVDINSSYVEVEPLSKVEVQEMLVDFYYHCLKTAYRNGYADLGGRGNSEGQSYALLQSVWMDNHRTFRNVWIWTRENLQRSEDHLFSWDFDLRHNFMTFPFKKAHIKDANSATDADLDIAYALFLAADKWDRDDYRDEARKIMKGIWENEVTEHEGRLYLLPGKWGANENEIVINTSYFSPAAFKEFAKYDTEHDWGKLSRDSYLNLQAIRNNLNRGQNNEYPPNWAVLDKQSGQMTPFVQKSDSYDYSYDAFRTLWRAGLDQLRSPNFESWDYVSSFNDIEGDWNDDQNLCSMYRYSNGNLVCDELPTGIAGKLGVLSVTNGHLAEQVVKRYYIHDGQLKFPESEFYPRSWHWFGVYLWSKS